MNDIKVDIIMSLQQDNIYIKGDESLWLMNDIKVDIWFKVEVCLVS